MNIKKELRIVEKQGGEEGSCHQTSTPTAPSPLPSRILSAHPRKKVASEFPPVLSFCDPPRLGGRRWEDVGCRQGPGEGRQGAGGKRQGEASRVQEAGARDMR